MKPTLSLNTYLLLAMYIEHGLSIINTIFSLHKNLEPHECTPDENTDIL